MDSNWELAKALLPLQFSKTLYMVFFSSFFGFLLGLPMGIFLFLTQKGGMKQSLLFHKTLSFLVNIGRSFPFAVLMVALIPLTRFLLGTSLGTTAAIVPLTIAAAPSIARIVETALNGVDSNVIEAAIVMGSSIRKILSMLLQEALPNLIAGITLTLIHVIGYSAMAGLVGGGGLGQVAIQYGYYRFNTFMMGSTVLLLIFLVQIVQWAGNFFTEALLKKRGKSYRA